MLRTPKMGHMLWVTYLWHILKPHLMRHMLRTQKTGHVLWVTYLRHLLKLHLKRHMLWTQKMGLMLWDTCYGLKKWDTCYETHLKRPIFNIFKKNDPIGGKILRGIRISHPWPLKTLIWPCLLGKTCFIAKIPYWL